LKNNRYKNEANNNYEEEEKYDINYSEDKQEIEI
jgi:hypothetical protein